MSDDARRTRVDKGRVPQVTRRGVTVLHLAFCADLMRDSAVRRADLPTTSPASRGARDVHGVLEQPPATRLAATLAGAAIVGPGQVMTRYGLSRWLPPRGARAR